MLTAKGRQLLWREPQGFAATHCKNCAAGWTRTGKDGSLTICLLDREPVLMEMTDCDRFEPKEDPARPSLRSPLCKRPRSPIGPT